MAHFDELQKSFRCRTRGRKWESSTQSLNLKVKFWQLAASVLGNGFFMQILYVENHARFAKLTVAQFLTSHQVKVVPSVAAAREALSHTTFDVVLVDYDLDDGKGDEIVKELKRQSHRPLIVAVSSHQAGNNALVAAGADEVCSKMQFSKIQTILTQLLHNGG